MHPTESRLNIVDRLYCVVLDRKAHPSPDSYVSRLLETGEDKVLQKLGHAGLVASQHGTKGGYTLGRSPDEIKALEVVESIEGPVSLAQCFSTEGSCVQFEKCNLKSPLQQLNDIVVRILAEVTVAQLVEKEFKGADPSLDHKPGSADLLPLAR